MVDRTDEEKQDKKPTENKKEVKTEVMMPLATIKRILKEQGVTRIEKPALEEIRMILQDILRDMSRKIIVFTRHRKAKTSTKEDVLLSIR